MTVRTPILLLSALPFVVAAERCVVSDPDPEWFFTCGDPVCQGYTGPTEGVALCTSETAGEACTNEGKTCDPEDDCNAMLICATEDPTAGPGGCPISKRAAKHDIQYLSDAERSAAAAQVLDMRLATWAYNGQPDAERAHLGFIIDDVGVASPAVTPDGGHVDLYGYTSLTLAAVQAQEQRIRADEARIARLEAEIVELRALVRAR